MTIGPLLVSNRTLNVAGAASTAGVDGAGGGAAVAVSAGGGASFAHAVSSDATAIAAKRNRVMEPWVEERKESSNTDFRDATACAYCERGA